MLSHSSALGACALGIVLRQAGAHRAPDISYSFFASTPSQLPAVLQGHLDRHVPALTAPPNTAGPCIHLLHLVACIDPSGALLDSTCLRPLFSAHTFLLYVPFPPRQRRVYQTPRPHAGYSVAQRAVQGGSRSKAIERHLLVAVHRGRILMGGAGRWGWCIIQACFQAINLYMQPGAQHAWMARHGWARINQPSIRICVASPLAIGQHKQAIMGRAVHGLALWRAPLRHRGFPVSTLCQAGLSAAHRHPRASVVDAGVPQRAVRGPGKQQAQQGHHQEDEIQDGQLVPAAANVDVAIPAHPGRGCAAGVRGRCLRGPLGLHCCRSVLDSNAPQLPGALPYWRQAVMPRRRWAAAMLKDPGQRACRVCALDWQIFAACQLWLVCLATSFWATCGANACGRCSVGSRGHGPEKCCAQPSALACMLKPLYPLARPAPVVSSPAQLPDSACGSALHGDTRLGSGLGWVGWVGWGGVGCG